MDARLSILGFGFFLAALLSRSYLSTMAANYQRPKGEDGAFSSLNEAIDALNHAKGSSITPAKAAFGAIDNLLCTIRVGFHPVHVGRLLANSNVHRIR